MPRRRARNARAVRPFRDSMATLDIYPELFQLQDVQRMAGVLFRYRRNRVGTQEYTDVMTFAELDRVRQMNLLVEASQILREVFDLA